MRAALSALVLVTLLSPGAQAQVNLHDHHHPLPQTPAGAPAAGTAAAGAVLAAPIDHSGHLHSHGDNHSHDLGPPGRTYDLRWLDAMVQHHTGAMRMSAFVFDIGAPGVGSLAKEIWRDQAGEIKAM
jgi:uncharacterized protein (DUF305 family)